MSPEQVSGAPVDGRSDIFSLGVVLYELLTNRKPFLGDNLTAISYKIVHEDFTPPAELSIEVPPEFNAIVARAMAKDPWNRYQRGKDLALALYQLKAHLEEQKALEDLGTMVSAAENLPTLKLSNLQELAAMGAPARLVGHSVAEAAPTPPPMATPTPPPMARAATGRRSTPRRRRRPPAAAVSLLREDRGQQPDTRFLRPRDTPPLGMPLSRPPQRPRPRRGRAAEPDSVSRATPPTPEPAGSAAAAGRADRAVLSRRTGRRSRRPRSIPAGSGPSASRCSRGPRSRRLLRRAGEDGRDTERGARRHARAGGQGTPPGPGGRQAPLRRRQVRGEPGASSARS